MGDTLMSDLIAGLDLGQAQDPTALAILSRSCGPDPKRPDHMVNSYVCHHLQRFALGTSYPDIIRQFRDLLNQNPNGRRVPALHGLTFAVDQTGVGAAVVDILREARLPIAMYPIHITEGNMAHPEGGLWHVPKKELASDLQAVLQCDRLLIA